ncbi:MAG: TraR/DksA family transcriptional regulator, partial [Betaproteobacteria bacterium]|nr:TraR/DksA family transcriptional regulator [Betaproteobacteria bacterium]
LERLDAGHYGECKDCGIEIPETRLNAYPAALRCISCQTTFENRLRAWCGVLAGSHKKSQRALGWLGLWRNRAVAGCQNGMSSSMSSKPVLPLGDWPGACACAAARGAAARGA